MKHTDLMLNDLVMCQGKILRVGCISDYDIKIDLFEDGEDTPYAEIWQEELDEIQPIPLTEKTLEKSGFTHRNADKILTKQSWTCECGGCTIHAKYNFGFLYFNIYGKPLKPNMFAPHATMHIQYVHELQHALRLCGFDKEITL